MRQKAARRREQRRMKTGAVLLTMMCALALGAMAFVNHMPMGGRYTYTDRDDLWYVEDGDMVIAAPALLFSMKPTAEPTATPEATATAAPSATPEPSATAGASATPEPSATAVPGATPEPAGPGASTQPRPIATHTAAEPA